MEKEIEQWKDFIKDFGALISKYGLENDANIPDYLISDYLLKAYWNLVDIIEKRDSWYNVHLEPGNKYFKDKDNG